MFHIFILCFFFSEKNVIFHEHLKQLKCQKKMSHCTEFFSFTFRVTCKFFFFFLKMLYFPLVSTVCFHGWFYIQSVILLQNLLETAVPKRSFLLLMWSWSKIKVVTTSNRRWTRYWLKTSIRISWFDVQSREKTQRKVEIRRITPLLESKGFKSLDVLPRGTSPPGKEFSRGSDTTKTLGS